MPHYIDTSGEALPRMYGIEHEFLLFAANSKKPTNVSAESIVRNLPEGLHCSTVDSNGSRRVPPQFLTNGGRLYLDIRFAYEYATPECLSIDEVVAAEIVGEQIAMNALTMAGGHIRGEDGDVEAVFNYGVRTPSGNSVGHHENYLTSRQTNMLLLYELFSGYLSSRVLFNGNGYVQQNAKGELEYKLGQKISDIRKDIQNSTCNINKPLINTRDEPHADARYWRRIHVTSGDASLSPYVRHLSLGSASLVIRLAEWADDIPNLVPDIETRNIVGAAKTFSADLTGTKKVPMRRGANMSALDIQARLIEAAHRLHDKIELPPGEAVALHEWAQWESDMRSDPSKINATIPSFTKKELIDRALRRKNIDPNTKEGFECGRKVDYITTELSSRGMGLKRRTQGIDQEYMPDPERIHELTFNAPDGRARVRAEFIKAHQGAIKEADWESVNLIRSDSNGVQHVSWSNPFEGTDYKPAKKAT